MLKMSEPEKFYSGTSNVVLPVPNKSHFPPEFQNLSRLKFYASLFNSVEVNSTFYKLPMPRTVARWTEEAGPQFRFTFKIWKQITHNKELVYERADIEKFFAAVNACKTSRGCILIQFPGSVRASYFHKVRQLLDDISECRAREDWKLAVEFRDRSWYTDAVYQVLEQHRACIVQHDMPKAFTPQIDMDVDFRYLRFHGEKGDYRGGYSREFLEDHAEFIRHQMAEGKTIYAYFNNTMGDAVHNAMDLDGFVRDDGFYIRSIF